ncbi:MAG: LacI family DNA-binding transcriptional regulator [Nonomuraea sp.]|nr:LacI family DNA-binding transcriptional regulator [Nonomuraea sp.]
MAGVSQTTVSLVLNNRAEGEVRLAAETRERVLRVIRETGYIADPAARRLAEGRNRILGVFTYEAVFPAAGADFYHPFLVGIEECAEQVGSDVLLFTSSRRMFGENSRIRLADGCVLLGRSLDRDDLARLLADRIPFVSVGRRDDAGGPVPYVGADYPAAVRALVARAVELGHRSFVYVGAGAGPESHADRYRGFVEGTRGLEAVRVGDPEAVLDCGATVAFFEEEADAVPFVGRGLSIVALGTATRPVQADIDFTGFHIPRREMGHRAVELLTEVLESGGTPQELLPCELIAGSTLNGR